MLPEALRIIVNEKLPFYAKYKQVITDRESIVQMSLIDKLWTAKSSTNLWYTGFCLVFCLYFLTGCRQSLPDSQLERVINEEVLRVGVQYGITTYYNGAVTPQGFEYEMAQRFAEYLGVELEVYPYYQPDELYSNIQKGNIHLIASNILVTDENKKLLSFSPAYQNLSHKLVFLQGQPRPRDFSQLSANIVIASDSGDTHLIKKLRNISEQPENAHWNVTLTDDMDEQEKKEKEENDKKLKNLNIRCFSCKAI